jgi:hypothetical protein
MPKEAVRDGLVESVDSNVLVLSPHSEVNGIANARRRNPPAVPVLLELVGVIIQVRTNCACAEESRFPPAANQFLEHGLPPADATSARRSTPEVMLSCPVWNRRSLAEYGLRRVSGSA